MVRRELIGGRECLIYAAPRPQVLLLQTLNVKERAGLEREAAMIAGASPVPAVLAAFAIEDWKRELTPWRDPAVSRREGDGDHAGETLAYVTDVLLPFLYGEFGVLPAVLGGYSLGGLFALWAATRCDRFAAIAAASPSVWIKGWREFAEANPVLSPHVYLSLGDLEEQVRNRDIARVGANIRFEYDLLCRRPGDGRCTLEWNVGGHFEDFARRNARAFVWCARAVTR